ncbi:MAG: hypothetical protein ACFFBZ_04350 [Promethearchaeota archaeon]
MRIASGALLFMIGFVCLIADIVMGAMYGLSFASPILGIFLGVFFGVVGTAGLLLMIDGIKSD